MKPLITMALICLFTAFSTTNAIAQKFPSIDKSPHDISYYRADRNAPPTMKIVYGRPLKNGRTIFGGIIPYDKVWRTGANEATEITFYKDVVFGGQAVKAGTYSLFTIPGKKEWTFILNKDLDIWGAYSYKEDLDVARVVVPVEKLEDTIELFQSLFLVQKAGVEFSYGGTPRDLGYY